MCTYSMERGHCPWACCTRYAFSVKMFLSVMRLCLSSVCMQGDLACDLGKTQQAGVMMQPVTALLSLFYLENTSPFPPNPLAALLTQMCHQLHAVSEECLKFCSCTQADLW